MRDRSIDRVDSQCISVLLKDLRLADAISKCTVIVYFSRNNNSCLICSHCADFPEVPRHVEPSDCYSLTALLFDTCRCYKRGLPGINCFAAENLSFKYRNLIIRQNPGNPAEIFICPRQILQQILYTVNAAAGKLLLFICVYSNS